MTFDDPVEGAVMFQGKLFHIVFVFEMLINVYFSSSEKVKLQLDIISGLLSLLRSFYKCAHVLKTSFTTVLLTIFLTHIKYFIPFVGYFRF